MTFVADDETDEFTIHIARYRPQEIHKLASKTKFTKKEIQLIYRGFKQVLFSEFPFLWATF